MKHPFEVILSRYRSGYRQKHDCLCGPASFGLVAESLGLGPYSEESWVSSSWKKWMPTDDFLSRGLALHEGLFMTEVVLGKSVEITLRRAFPENKALFLNDLKAVSSNHDSGIVVNFAQDHLMGKPLNGQGFPHYSPIAGFDSSTQQVVIADVDQEVTQEYSVSVDRCFEGMIFENPAFGIPRGWLLFRKRHHQDQNSSSQPLTFSNT